MYSGCDPFACSTHNEVIRCCGVPVCYVSQPPPRPSVVVLATKTRFPTEWSRVVPTGPQFVPVDSGHRRCGGVRELPSHAHSCLAHSNRQHIIVLRETVSSYTLSSLIDGERHATHVSPCVLVYDYSTIRSQYASTLFQDLLHWSTTQLSKTWHPAGEVENINKNPGANMP